MADSHIEPLATINADWSETNRLSALNAVRQLVTGKLDNAIRWYRDKGRRKNEAAFKLRILAIGLGTLAAAWPTVTEMIARTNATTPWWGRPSLVTILAVLVGALILLDKLLGASSGWIRYTMAGTALKEVRDELELAYALEVSSWTNSKTPSIEETRRSMALLQNLLLRGNQIVREETNQWKIEFQSAIAQTEDFAKSLPKKVEEAILIVKIANPDQLVDTWSLSVNNTPPDTATGDSKCLRLPPGIVTVKISADVKSGKDGTEKAPFTTEAGDILVAGASKTITVTLPARRI